MKRTWVEISCDNCGYAEHYTPGGIDKQARRNGWIITKNGKCYCAKECYRIAKEKIKKMKIIGREIDDHNMIV